MSALTEVVDSLEKRIHKLLQNMEMLKESNSKLSKEIDTSKRKITEQQQEIATWEEKYNTLKMADAILGSNKNKKETKLTLNTLIKEIDRCIAQLSE